MTPGKLFSALQSRRDVTVRAMQEALIRHIGGYAAYTTSQRARLSDEIHLLWEPVLRQAPSGEPLGEEHLSVFRAIGRQRAGVCFPVDDLRESFRVAHAAGLGACLQVAEEHPRVHDELIDLTAWSAREQPRVLKAVLDAYAGARIGCGDRREARELLVARLLDGVSGDTQAGAPLPKGYALLLCRTRRRDAPGAGRPTQVEDALAAVPGALWRGDLAGEGLLVLLPVTGDPASALKTGAELAAALTVGAGDGLHIAQALATTPEGVPEAYREAREILPLVVAMPDTQSRPYGADELLVELALHRQPPLQLRLAALLAPLESGTDLRRTLEVLFASGLDREQAAQTLFIHRRTLTYRMQRIRQLTGLDIGTAHGIQLLRTALTASRLHR